ncbi:hypothetical protein JGU71_10285 [Antrihabitans sp. YC3-6]|uniref:DUF6802 domain-containing protein n=1 Tax=Antrihabitans stalagmiti TaxID=2799499 RepID=A0A934NQ77_9NOCA|nr:DUF6802 family protein [Antrihabitans stalagmiti]MBJ8339277.1 hypothetical protein [Antrihabitans stalagmiti]
MIASNEFPGIPELTDASTPLENLGAVELDTPGHDIDADGTLDTETFRTDDAFVVATDTDLDGFADHLTIVDTDGDFAAWEFHHSEDGETHWKRTDNGKLGE